MDGGLGQIVANWIPGPLLAVVILALVKREIGRNEKVLDDLRATTMALKEKLTEIILMTRDFITIKSHGESTSRIYEEMRKIERDLDKRVHTLEIVARKGGSDV